MPIFVLALFFFGLDPLSNIRVSQVSAAQASEPQFSQPSAQVPFSVWRARLLSEYLWAKDSYLLVTWPTFFEQTKQWPQRWSHLKVHEQAYLQLVLELWQHPERAKSISERVSQIKPASLSKTDLQILITLASGKSLNAQQIAFVGGYYALFFKGLQHLQKGNASKAEIYFNKLPKTLIIQEALGNVYSKLDAQKALTYYQKAQLQDAKLARLYVKMARVYQQTLPQQLPMLFLQAVNARDDLLFYPDLDRWALKYWTVQKYVDVLSDATTEQTQVFLNARAYLLKGKTTQALALFRQSEKRFALPAFQAQFQWFFEQEQWGKLDELIQRAKHKVPEGMLFYWQGTAAAKQKKYTQAIELLKPLVQHDQARLSLAMVYQQTGQLNKARILLKSLLQKNPSQAELWLKLAATYPRNSSQAMKMHKQALWLAPYEPRVLTAVGEFLVDKKEWKTASWYLERSVLLLPQNVALRNTLGTVYLAQRRLKLAEYFFLQVLERDPKNLEQRHDLAYYNLACVASLEKNTKRAKDYLFKAFTLNPHLKSYAEQDPDLNYLKTQSRGF